MAPPALLTRLVFFITLLLGVFAVEHAAPESKTPKRQAGYPRAFVRDHNVWAAYSSTDEKPITTTGTPQNPFDPDNVYLSPIRNHVVVWQYTPEEEHKITYIESSPSDRVEPKFERVDYPKPGDRVRFNRPRMFHLTARIEIPTNDTLFLNHYQIHNLGWAPDGSEYRFDFNERGHQRYRVIGISVNSTVRAIVDESTSTFFDYNSKLYINILDDTKELLWFSERDGWNHLYLYDLATGTVKNQVTQGNFVVRSVERVDPDTRRIWFTAYGIVPGQDPYYAHLVRVQFDGIGRKILTSGGGNDGNGTHTWTIDEAAGTFVDTFSRVDMPPTVLVRNFETGQVLNVLSNPAPPNPSSLVAEPFVAPGRDGQTPIHGVIVKPRFFDPSRKYPVIEHIYAGPFGFFAPKAWDDLGDLPEWADTGYVVVKLDGMGTNWRHRAFHEVAHKNLRDAGFPDRIEWIKAAAATRPWMDATRVGALGGSAGGQNAMAALLFHNDFYKAAMAESGCHDNRMDKMAFGETWLGWPVGQQYADSSNVVNAHRLQGKLLLIVGELDKNVDPSSTYQVVNALNKANKEYDFVLMPGEDHGAGFTPYGKMRTKAFFRKNLLGV